eukprot:8846746-Alexandrium_andersonii.AAC.1
MDLTDWRRCRRKRALLSCSARLSSMPLSRSRSALPNGKDAVSSARAMSSAWKPNSCMVCAAESSPRVSSGCVATASPG